MTVSAHVVARFSDGGDSFPLSIEADPGLYSGFEIPLLLSPPDVATVIGADIGSVRKDSIKSIDVPAGRLSFSGGNTASLPRLPVTPPTFTTIFAADADTGALTTVSIDYDAATNTVRASKNVHALVSYTAYRSRAQRLLYKPKTDALPGGGTAATYGIVYAFAPKSNFAMYEFPLDLLPGQFEFEIYRITSQVVTNQDGAHERPPNFPTSGAYPGKDFVLDISGYQESKRVHEVGMMTAVGTPFVRLYFHSNLKPYFGDSNYTPVKTLEPSTLPTDNDLDPRLILQAKNIIAARGFGKL